MKTSVKGKLRNTKLPLNKSLLPLFEAIVNSIHSIESTSDPLGKIDIFIERESSLLQNDNRELRSITGFRVVDPGPGFNEDNFLSFQTSDSTFKEDKGSKGIGRFLWLKAFSLVQVNSYFLRRDGIYCQRRFNFQSSDEGIEGHNLISESDDEKIETSVKLVGFLEQYRKQCPQKVLTLARKILEHCLVYFLNENPPTIRLIDSDETISINQLFNDNVKPNSEILSFNVGRNSLSITNFKLFFPADDSEHSIHLCAHNREVVSRKLVKDIPDLQKRIEDGGDNFIYVGYVSGSYLDDQVNPNRTGFDIPKTTSELVFEDATVSLEQIEDAALDLARSYLAPFLEQIKSDKAIAVGDYVRSKAPQYRPLLKHYPNSLEQISPGISEDKLEIELYKISSRYSIELKERSQEILSNVDTYRKYDEYRNSYDKFIEEFNDFGKSNLSQYIVHRKAVLDLLSRSLERNKEGSFCLERDIHELIFPLRETSDDVDFERQNLWIIDEKLSYHRYLASDVALSKLDEIDSDSRDRPDLVIFNNPLAVVEGEAPYSSIVIVEFKRPMRNKYSDDENPISQVIGYVKKIREGKMLDKSGRVILGVSSIPFYAYIVCDITSKIKEFAELSSLTISPDGMGYFGYNSPSSTYIEIISFDRLIQDAKKRNRILFDKLHLPL